MNHLLIISDGYPSPGLPYSAFIANMAEEMTRQGVIVNVIAPQSLTKHWLRRVPLAPRYFTQNIAGRTIHIYRPLSITMGEGRFGFVTRWFNRYMTFRTAQRLNKPDAVYAHFWQNAVNAIDYVQKHSLPLIVGTGEDKIPIEQINHTDKTWLYNTVTNVICVSTKNKQESIAHGLTRDACCHVLPNAYNPEDFYHEDGVLIRENLGIKPTDFVVAFCGRWNERKGVFRLDSALKQLNNPYIKAIYIGSPMDNCKKEPDYTNIAFKGQLPHNEIVHYLNAADVFVLPSLAEGCPNSTIEAMACGLPIVSSDMAFNYDILDSTNSILINPNDIDAIANAIQSMLLNTTLCKQLSQGALASASILRIATRVQKIRHIIQSSIKQNNNEKSN